MRRRDFIRTGIGGILTSTYVSQLLADLPVTDTEIPKRIFKDDVRLSIIGFGGIVVVGMKQKEADQIVALSHQRGVNYFDVAPSYWDGEAEMKLGKALRPIRKEIFLACKTEERSAAGARKELEQSLRRLGTDYFDLYQFHAVSSSEDVDAIFSPAGALEVFVKAQMEGKIRYIGFSAHTESAALALLDRFSFDSILFPLNMVCALNGDFGPRVFQRARQNGAARLALKMFAHSPLPEGQPNPYPKCWYRPVDERDLARSALRFTLSQDITAAIPPGDERLYLLALELAPGFQPLSPEEQIELAGSIGDIQPLFYS